MNGIRKGRKQKERVWVLFACVLCVVCVCVYVCVCVFWLLLLCLAQSLQPLCCLLELDALGKGQLGAVVDGDGGSAHVLLPGVAAGFAAAARLLLATKGTANLCTVGGDVDVDNARVGAKGADPLEDLGWVAREHAAGQALAGRVVDGNGLLKGLELGHIQDGGKGLGHDA